MPKPSKSVVIVTDDATNQKELEYTFLPLAGLTRDDVTIVPVEQQVAIEGIQLVIAQGKLAFEYCNQGLREENGKPASLTKWRGFLSPELYQGVSVFNVLHPADLYHNPAMEVVTQWDWAKVRRILDHEYPNPLPPRLVITKDNLHDVRRWFLEARSARWIVCDTEYIPSTQHLTVLGLLASYPEGCTGCQLDTRTAGPQLCQEVYWHYKELIKHVPMVFHNCRADIPVLHNTIGIGANWQDYTAIEDTMLAHAVLWCELPHTLEFIASVLGKYPKLKHLKNNDELLYNFGDCLETDSIWHYFVTEGFKHDPQAENVYRTQHLKLAPLVDATVRRGLRVNRERVQQAREEFETQVVQAINLAHASAGWPINIHSPQQLGLYLYQLRGLPTQINKKSKNPSIDDQAIARLRILVGPPVDPEEELTYPQALERINQGADPILEARVLYIGAQTRLSKYVYSMYEEVAKVKEYNYGTQGAYKTAKDKALETVLSGKSTIILERCYPDILIHAQKTGRWSYIDPPIAQLPKGLRDVLIPDTGEVWITWDWSAIEPRILEAYCHSKVLKAAFDEGIDLHTWTVCSIFGYDFPPNLCDVMGPDNVEWRAKYKWKHSNDPRRVFAKTARYEMYYGGTGHNAAEASALYGLDAKVLKRACASLISADPEYYKWRLELEETIKRTRVLRTFMGRPRRFLTGGHKMVREGLDYQAQGGVSDIANTTVMLLASLAIPGFQYAWGMHDSQYWHCPRELVTREFLQRVSSIAGRPHVIAGRVTQFPIDMEIVYPPGEKPIAELEEYS